MVHLIFDTQFPSYFQVTKLKPLVLEQDTGDSHTYHEGAFISGSWVEGKGRGGPSVCPQCYPSADNSHKHSYSHMVFNIPKASLVEHSIPMLRLPSAILYLVTTSLVCIKREEFNKLVLKRCSQYIKVIISLGFKIDIGSKHILPINLNTQGSELINILLTLI